MLILSIGIKKFFQALINSNFKQLHTRQVSKECTVYSHGWGYTYRTFI